MDLVPVDRNADQANLMLSESQRLLANVTTDTIRTGDFSSSRQLNGRVALDPSQIEYVTSRVPGRIENLYIRETGVSVKKGQILYRIYSEQLASLQQEYLVAAAQAEQFPDNARFQSILEAARQRLLLYDQSPDKLRIYVPAEKPTPTWRILPPPVGWSPSCLLPKASTYPREGLLCASKGTRTYGLKRMCTPPKPA